MSLCTSRLGSFLLLVVLYGVYVVGAVLYGVYVVGGERRYIEAWVLSAHGGLVWHVRSRAY